MLHNDPLRKAFEVDEKPRFDFKIPVYYRKTYKESRFVDLEFFGLSYYQRAVCFLIFFGLGIFTFIYSMFNILSAFFNPAKFAFPYALSNFLLFSMMGFVLGFRTYLGGIFQKDKRPYTVMFLASTFITLYSAIKIRSYFLNFAFAILQVTSFVVFVFTFVPGGTKGLSGISKMLFARFTLLK
ncbi:putative Got1/Sft2-like protein transport protein [Hamiltosporidium tvaerminnensis]|uniref:Protein transport protein SFT2 n=2 Tax=Hamiltosporidium TaxID=1176354 RepID=A0A4Q9KVS3_9MICR|nr:putative Got1/Sft2-like protein transport protein [Hamiltosporidium tvaerminnensis]TBT98983.1 putative Got1/Sft2-like protein transport protein [Hamiltosporidium magnivora]TBU07712.1 putative Got1/Sft2-like protein transport protein [Hamiltosporidium magnivora]TBU11247.1 putative Got1/Sft2-like protein transport protein [Hamiltosporidium tvaerminnensis]